MIELIKDDSVPWPLRIYYLQNVDPQCLKGKTVDSYDDQLNSSVLSFIKNDNSKPYYEDRIDEEEKK